MSLNFYRELAESMRRARETCGMTIEGIARRTRVKAEYLALMEQGHFDFAEPVLIRGYLTAYARTVGLDVEQTTSSYRAILEKIRYLSQEYYLGVPPVPVAEPLVVPVPAGPTTRASSSVAALAEQDEPSTAVDAEVVLKMRRERQINNSIMAAAAGLALLCLMLILFDHAQSSHEAVPADASREQVLPDTDKSPAAVPRRRRLWRLSEPILTDQERFLQEVYREKAHQDSLVRVKNLVSRTIRDNDAVVPVSIEDAARDLENRIEQ